MSPGRDLGADADDAALVEVGEHLLADVGDVAGDLLRPSFVSRASTSCSSMWIEVRTSCCTRTLRAG
jgi:hypothetical protein